jgi:ATP-dependent helicase HrpA
VLTAIEPVLKAFDDTCTLLNKLIAKNRGNHPVLNFLKEVRTELHSLVPIEFPEIYTFERMKELPRYCKALALRAERGSLNLASAQKKLQEVLIYAQQLQTMIAPEINDSTLPQMDIHEITRFKENIAVDCPEEKKTMIEEFFWMIEEYKVSLFAQELKTPYPVSPKKLNLLVGKIKDF